MDGSAGAALRWSRAVLLAAVAMGSGVVAHASADGRLPGPLALAVLYAGCLAVAGAALGRPASTRRVVALVVGGQTFIHLALTSLSGHHGDPPIVRSAPTPPPASPVPVPGPDGGHRVGSLYDQLYAGRPEAVPARLSVPVPVQHLLADLTGPHAVMALAHLVAAAALGWWLARGERLLWSLLALTASGLDTLTRQCARTAAGYAPLVALAAAVGRRLLAPVADAAFLPPAVLEHRVGVLSAHLVRRGPPCRVA